MKTKLVFGLIGLFILSASAAAQNDLQIRRKVNE